MSTTNAAEKSIVVRAVQRRRYTDTNGRTVRRIISFNGPILSSELEGMKDGDQVTLWIEETPQTQVAIGSITTDKEHREQLAPEIQLTLPHAAFTDFWNAASSTDSAPRNVTLKIEDAMMEFTLSNPVVAGESSGNEFVIRSVIDRADRTCDTRIEVDRGDGDTFSEMHRQYFHDDAEVRSALQDAGFTVTEVSAEYTHEPVEASTLRATWTARRL